MQWRCVAVNRRSYELEYLVRIIRGEEDLIALQIHQEALTSLIEMYTAAVTPDDACVGGMPKTLRGSYANR